MKIQNAVQSRLAALIAARISVLFVGPPGCAKTNRALAAAREAGADFVVLRASLSERIDFGGCLVPDLAAGITRALPLEMLTKLRAATKLTVLFIDDLGQAPIDVQAAIMSLWDSGTLPECVLIWGATNRPQDKAGVSALCEPLRSRFHVAFNIATPGTEETATGGTTLVPWRDEVEGWADWATEQGFAPEIIAWHRSTTGRTLYNWKPSSDPSIRHADFRSWHTVCRLWAAGIRDLNTLGAAVGKGVAAEFLAFAAICDQLPTPQQVWMDPDGAPVPPDVGGQYLIASMLAKAAEPKFADQLVRYASRLPRVSGAYCTRDAFKRLGSKLTGTAAWQRYWLENRALFESGN